jgi:LAO/AO transport system kinase
MTSAAIDATALARALTAVENDPSALRSALAALPAPPGRAHRVGVTGPPGAGKSTLIGALGKAWLARGRRVGVLAVDPTSPFSGGALLGDRVRMASLAGHAGAFVRSVASRGALGGLSTAVQDLADVLDAAGFDPVVVETVGAGQAEVAVASAADTTVVVVAPGTGDDVQAMKAGLLEAADLIVVNQSDREGADRLAADLRAAVDLREAGPRPQVLSTVATTGEGVEALLAAVEARGPGGPEADDLGRRRLERARARIREEVERRRRQAFWPGRSEALDRLAADVAAGRSDVAAAAQSLLGRGGTEDNGA